MKFVNITITMLLLLTVSCKKFVTVDAPVTSSSGTSVYNTDANAAGVLSGIYGRISKGGATSTGEFNSLSFFAGLSADEFGMIANTTNAVQLSHFKNQLSINSNSNFWGTIYPYIYTCNAAIEGLTKSNSLTPGVKQQLLGESKFMRAFFYFYLVNLYGDVPLVLVTDYSENTSLPRSSANKVYQQIIEDLKDAEALLSDKYLKGDALTPYAAGGEERVRPTKWAAATLLARVYLYTKDWSGAENKANTVLNNTSLFNLEALNNVFKKNSREAIWQLQPVNSGWNTEEARRFILPNSGPSTSFPIYLSPGLIGSFEIGDLRKANGNWVNSVTVSGITYYYPYKYKVNQQSTTSNPVSISEYSTIFRLAELYLIRAEARAQSGNFGGSQSDLNIIRQRAFGISNPTTANDKSSLITEILHERQVELFTEWGHRWFDLKRTSFIDPVMAIATPAKAAGTAWQSYQQLYPIPASEIQKNPSLLQNSNY